MKTQNQDDLLPQITSTKRFRKTMKNVQQCSAKGFHLLLTLKKIVQNSVTPTEIAILHHD